MGIDKLAAYMYRYGFGEPTGIDLTGENAGIVPSREWKAKHRPEPWYPGETVIAGIGQGYWVATTLQLARSEEHTSELQSLMRISYAVFCLKKKKNKNKYYAKNNEQNARYEETNNT